MEPFHDIQKKRAEAGLASLAISIALSVLGVYNWMELRAFVIGLLAALKVNPYAWQGIDNMTFLCAGIVWLGYVFYSQYYLRKQALAGRLPCAVSLLLAIQLWLLVLCRGVPALFGDTFGIHGTAIWAEGLAALLLTAYAWRSGRHSLRR